MVGITRVLRNSTAAPRMSMIFFTLFFSLLEKLERDTFMDAFEPANSFKEDRISEFVTAVSQP
jgi:hypothetical protein